MMKESSVNVLESLPVEITEIKVSSLGKNLSFVVYKKGSATLKGKLEPYLFLLPAIILFTLFMYYPFFKTMYLSMELTDARGRFVEFVGFQNYIDILTSVEFVNSLIITLKFVFYTTLPSLLIGFFITLLANNKVKLAKAANIMFSVPMAISSASAAIIWSIMFHPTIGLINNIFKTNIGWLVDPNWALFSVSFVTTWMNIGVNFIFLYAGLKNIPRELFESASIDGAGYFRKLHTIIIPMISPTLFFVVFMDIMNSFQSFGQVKIMTAGGPGTSTNLLVYSIYKDAFFNGRFDMASAQSIILFVIMFVIASIQFKFEKKGVHYS
ncbi:sn-glycerol-3-phosphate transport system permease protein UgpA [Clostridium puniceum]|uniref:sn-glycerol-3-phosphate transport system permease protein UgpA n=1 Tax=Clostridium puniceum TaxID=29367 RepID=A0A1S8TAD5_9CLOT|nr:sugar ABC transporter permease [Clostridium puniceum]OOM74716.1 sn-glycerol-3-phosphate transport system permease protein UgpA [Clostridium puniceum]